MHKDGAQYETGSCHPQTAKQFKYPQTVKGPHNKTILLKTNH
jgi:hypothetical protein